MQLKPTLILMKRIWKVGSRKGIEQKGGEQWLAKAWRRPSVLSGGQKWEINLGSLVGVRL